MSADLERVGFIGLGNMGSALAANLVGAGWAVVGYDAAGPEQAPRGVRFVASVADVARQVDVVVFSLPDGDVSGRVARDLAGAPPSPTSSRATCSPVATPPASPTR